MPDVAVSSRRMIDSPSDRLFCRKRKLPECSVNICLDLLLNFRFQLMSHTVDHFDPIVVERVMACRDHDPTVKILCPCHIGNTWSRRHMKQIDICPGCRQTCNQCIFKHVATASRILTDHNLRLVLFPIIPSKKSSDFKCMLYRQNFICLTTKSICSKIFSHFLLLNFHICFIVHFFCTISSLFFFII